MNKYDIKKFMNDWYNATKINEHDYEYDWDEWEDKIKNEVLQKMIIYEHPSDFKIGTNLIHVKFTGNAVGPNAKFICKDGLDFVLNCSKLDFAGKDRDHFVRNNCYILECVYVDNILSINKVLYNTTRQKDYR